MEVVSETVLVSADIVVDMYNNKASCDDYCLDACTCTKDPDSDEY